MTRDIKKTTLQWLYIVHARRIKNVQLTENYYINEMIGYRRFERARDISDFLVRYF